MEGAKSLKERISFKSKRIRAMLSIKKKNAKEGVPQKESQPEIDAESAPVNDTATQAPPEETQSTRLDTDTDIAQSQTPEQCTEACAVQDSEIAPLVQSVEEAQPEVEEGNPPVLVPTPTESPIPPPVSRESGTADGADNQVLEKATMTTHAADTQGLEKATMTADTQGLEKATMTAIIPTKRQLQTSKCQLETPKCRDCMRGITGGIDAMFYNICGARHQKVRLPVSTGITSRSPNQS
ncbi:hypothetical protein BSKO_01613 [Bryopsis sp. KO-2023]|nr:hypothetical protein BSKO_01613 [Bryopsis sp. KO-2023]